MFAEAEFVAEERYRKVVHFLHEKARLHTTVRTRQGVINVGWTVLPYPPYSSDLGPSGCCLLGLLKIAYEDT